MGEVLLHPAAGPAARPQPDMAEMRLVGARRFAECLAEVIARHAPGMTVNERREADEALRGLLNAIDEAERVARVAPSPACSQPEAREIPRTGSQEIIEAALTIYK